MRIGIVGASNCILSGNFTTVLAQQPGFTVDNLSLGGSTTTLLPYAMMRYDLRAYDVVIVDVMINEYQEIRSGGHCVSAGLKHLRGFANDLRAADIPVIFTIMPHKEAVARDDYDFIALYKQAAALLGCHVIDMYEAAMAAMLKGVHPDSLWQDVTHMTPALQQVLAQRVVSLLTLLKQQQSFQANQNRPKQAFQRAATPADFISGDTPFETIHRASSLVSPTYVRLPVNTPITVYAPSGVLFGLAYNSIKFAGSVHLSFGDVSVEKILHDPDAETLQNKPGFDFRHRVIPFEEIRTHDGSALMGELIFKPDPNCPAQYAEIECLYGGQTAALPIRNDAGFFESETELKLVNLRHHGSSSAAAA